MLVRDDTSLSQIDYSIHIPTSGARTMGIRSYPWVAFYFNLVRSTCNELVGQIDFQLLEVQNAQLTIKFS
jgi:hypothetical protein